MPIPLGILATAGVKSESHFFIAAGDNGEFVTSTNAVTWTTRSSSFSTRSIGALGFGAGLFVALARDEDVNGYSSDGINWTTATTFGSGRDSTRFLNNLFVSGTGSGVNHIWTSTNGITWTNRTSPAGASTGINGVAYGNGIYAIVGGYSSTWEHTNLQTSTNAITWTSRDPGGGNLGEMGGIAFGAGVFVIGGGDNGNVRSSTDGITWTSRTWQNGANRITAVEFFNNLFVMGGSLGLLSTSTDGITWTSRTTGTTRSITSFTYGNGLYVMAANIGTITTSTDAITWTSRTTGTTRNLNTITYGLL